MATVAGTHIKEKRVEAIYSILSILLFDSADGLIQREEGWKRAVECGERAGREEEGLFWSLWTVITTYSCFLPGALTGHQQREGERRIERGEQGERSKNAHIVKVLVLFIISQKFPFSLHKSPFSTYTLRVSPCRQEEVFISGLKGSWRGYHWADTTLPVPDTGDRMVTTFRGS